MAAQEAIRARLCKPTRKHAALVHLTAQCNHQNMKSLSDALNAPASVLRLVECKTTLEEDSVHTSRIPTRRKGSECPPKTIRADQSVAWRQSNMLEQIQHLRSLSRQMDDNQYRRVPKAQCNKPGRMKLAVQLVSPS